MPATRLSLVCCAACLCVPSVGQPSGSRLEQFLSKRFGARTPQLAALKRGEAFALPLPGSVPREVIVAGAIRIEAPVERTVELIRDIARLESGKGFINTRKLSAPPRLEDFDSFMLSEEDLNALRYCRPGKCEVKLGKAALDSVLRINWNAPDVATQVNLLARRAALQFVNAYQKGGNGELAVYLDSDHPTFVAQEFNDMMQHTSLLPEAIPELAAFLKGFPAVAKPKDADDFYYWSEAEFGLKPVFRLNHVVIQRTLQKTMRYAIATKQLYANHYFHSALELRALLDDETQPGRAHYMVVINLARIDGLTGLFSPFVRAKVRSASREGLERTLRATKMLAEGR